MGTPTGLGDPTKQEGPHKAAGNPQSSREPTTHHSPVLQQLTLGCEMPWKGPSAPKCHQALHGAGQLPRDAQSILPLPDHKSCSHCPPVLPIDLLLFRHLLLLEEALRALKRPGWSCTGPLPGWMDQDL